MSSPGLWLRWSLRDLRRRWAVVVATALVLAIGTGVFAGLGGLEDWRKASNDASYASLRAHDLRVTLTEGAFAPAGVPERALRRLPARSRPPAIEERLVTDTAVEVRAGGRPIRVPGRMYGIDPGGRSVDAVAVSAGRDLRPRDAGRPVVVLEESFARTRSLPGQGTLRLAGGHALRWVGTGVAPDQFLVIRDENWSSQGSFAVVYAPLRTAQAIARRPGRINEIVLRLPPGTDARQARRDVTAALRRALPATGFEITARPDEAVYRVLYRDAEGDQQLMDIFALLLLGGAAFATFNLVSRVVDAERREIGVGMALGARPSALALRPLLLALEISALGTVLGVGVGLLLSEWLASVFREQLPLPAYAQLFDLGTFAAGAAIGALMPLAAAVWPVWRSIRVTPIEAIRVGFRSAKSGGLAPITRRLSPRRGSLALLPVRNLLRAPRRTLMTLLGLAAVIVTVVVLSGTLDSFVGTLDRSSEEARGATPDRITVTFDGFLPARSPAISSIARTPGVRSIEPQLRVPATAVHDGREVGLSLGVIDAGSRMWRPTVADGRFGRGTPGVVISEKAARDLGVRPGDTVALRHPRRTGPSTVGLATDPVRVAAVHPDPLRGIAYLDASQAPRLGLAGAANTVAVDPVPGAGDRVTAELSRRPGVSAVEPVTALADATRDAMDQFLAVVRVTALIAFALALLMAFNSVSISGDERVREHATMLAYGLPVRTIVWLTVAEGTIIGVLGSIAGFGLGLLMLEWVVSGVIPDTWPELDVAAAVSAESIVLAAAVGVLAGGLAPVILIRRLGRLDVPSALRVVE